MLTSATRTDQGFSLIELMITVVLIGIVMALAMPSFSTWIRNSQVRVVADALQSGLRLAQTESVRRYRQVVFFRTTAKECDTGATASAAGPYWQIRTIAAVVGDPVEAVRCGVLTDVANGVTLAGPTALCFNADGRQTANASTGVTGATCSLDPQGAASVFNVTRPSVPPSPDDRALRVSVAMAGSVRMCDPARNISTFTDGCP